MRVGVHMVGVQCWGQAQEDEVGQGELRQPALGTEWRCNLCGRSRGSYRMILHSKVK